jgi:hypothetical protein
LLQKQTIKRRTSSPNLDSRFIFHTVFLHIDYKFSLVGRWTPLFLSINDLCPRFTSTIRTYLRGFYVEKLCKAS